MARITLFLFALLLATSAHAQPRVITQSDVLIGWDEPTTGGAVDSYVVLVTYQNGDLDTYTTAVPMLRFVPALCAPFRIFAVARNAIGNSPPSMESELIEASPDLDGDGVVGLQDWQLLLHQLEERPHFMSDFSCILRRIGA